MLILNHKLNLTIHQTGQYLDYLKSLDLESLDLIVCPTMIYLPYYLNIPNLRVGAQNFEIDNITGEVSLLQIKKLNIKYAIVGHNSRLHYFGENSESINNKIKNAIVNNITPIVCVGESIEERQNNQTKETILSQLDAYFKDIKSGNIIIAYEPIWAIGTQKTPTIDEISEIISMIKNHLNNKYSVNVKTVYGGSINKDNILEFKNIPNNDGLLISKSSLDIEELSTIIDIYKR